MKVRYECDCEFDSTNEEDMKSFKYAFPDKCPKHPNYSVKKLDAIEHGVYFEQINF